MLEGMEGDCNFAKKTMKTFHHEIDTTLDHYISIKCQTYELDKSRWNLVRDWWDSQMQQAVSKPV